MTVEENLKFREKIIKRQFKERVGYDLNLEDPKTFNEKIQWLKLYYHDPLMAKCADKYLSREYIKEKIGEKYLVPLLGVWDKPEDIDFDSLPNQFVLKVNWGSGQNIIVKDKSILNIDDAKNKLMKWVEFFSNNYYGGYELAYKYIKPRIICEQFISDMHFNNLTVYKIFCFSGNPYMIHVILDDKTDTEKTNFYDLEWNNLNIRQLFDNFDSIDKPKNLNKMVELSSIISNDLDIFVRIDFYEVNDKLYFSEFAFYPDNGMGKFEPVEWDHKLGDLIMLPKEKKLEYSIIDKNTAIEQLLNLESISSKYKELEKDSVYKDKYKKLKNNFFALFGFLNEDDYFTLVIFGIKIVFKKKTRPDQTRPDQTRPDQTRPEYVKSTYYSIIIQNIKNYNLCYA